MLNARVRYISKEHVPQQKEIVRNEVKKTTKVALSRIQVQDHINAKFRAIGGRNCKKKSHEFLLIDPCKTDIACTLRNLEDKCHKWSNERPNELHVLRHGTTLPPLYDLSCTLSHSRNKTQDHFEHPDLPNVLQLHSNSA